MGLDLMLLNYQFTEAQATKIMEALEEVAAENVEADGEEFSQLLTIMRKQTDLQVGRIGEIVLVACSDCKKSMNVPNELLKGKFLETSVEFFCPFCDAECKQPRCVVCRVVHHQKHIPNAEEQLDATRVKAR